MNSDLSTAMFDVNTVFSFQPQHSQQEGVKFSGTNAVLDGYHRYHDLRGVNLSSVSFQNSDLSIATFDV